jgi:hypothetical protein
MINHRVIPAVMSDTTASVWAVFPHDTWCAAVEEPCFVVAFARRFRSCATLHFGRPDLAGAAKR